MHHTRTACAHTMDRTGYTHTRIHTPNTHILTKNQTNTLPERRNHQRMDETSAEKSHAITSCFADQVYFCSLFMRSSLARTLSVLPREAHLLSRWFYNPLRMGRTTNPRNQTQSRGVHVVCVCLCLCVCVNAYMQCTRSTHTRLMIIEGGVVCVCVGVVLYAFHDDMWRMHKYAKGTQLLESMGWVECVKNNDSTLPGSLR